MRTLLSAGPLNFAYDAKLVLREVSIALSAGELVTLLGPNGSGKSTLIRCLLGHLRSKGTVRWDGRALSEWSRWRLSRFVAYLPQFPTFEAGQTVGDVMRLGRAPYWGAFGLESPRDLEVVREVAALLELGEFLDRPVDELSGGQRQRVFVGRCLAQEPRAMLLDEPSTGLDLRHQVELLRLLERLARERSLGVLMASHDLNLAASFADRLVLLQDGAIAAEGSADDVLQPPVLQRVYGLEVQRIERPGHPPMIVPEV